MADSIDLILDRHIGGGGWFQWKNFLLMMPLEIVSVFPLFLQVFTAHTPVHWCTVNICQNETDLSWRDFALPQDYSAKDFLTDGQPFDPCNSYSLIDQEGGCTADNFNQSDLVSCQGFSYDETEFSETITTKFDLVCGDEHKARLLGTMTMLGLLVGSAIGGHIGDVLGRKMALLISLAVMAPAVAAGGLATSYELYAFLRFVTCCCPPIVWINQHNAVLEVFSAKYRTMIACAKDMYIPLGYVAVALVVYLVPQWSLDHYIIGAMCASALLFWLWTDESLRWLVQNGKLDKALLLAQKMAAANGHDLSESDVPEVKAMLLSISEVHSAEHLDNKLSIKDMFRQGYACTTFLVAFIWSTSVMGNFTLALNSTMLSGSIYLNYSFMGLTYIPACALMYISIRKLGRVMTMAVFFGVLGVCCLTLAFIPKTLTTLVFWTYIIGKVFGCGVTSLCWLVCSELYPTNLRSQAVGVCSTAARVFGLLCPFVPSLAALWKPLPMVVLGLPCLAAGGLAYALMPDSSGNLPQSLEEALEKNIKGQSTLKVVKV